MISIIGLYFNFKKKPKANLVSYLALTIVIVAIFLGKETGTTGGEIRHTEIRQIQNSIEVSNSKQ